MVSGNRFLQIIHSFLQDFLKIVSPLLLPLLKFQNFHPPPPPRPHPFLPKIFNLCITSLPKMTTNTFSSCITSYDSHEQKQVSRSKLIIQIHKNIQFTIIYPRNRKLSLLQTENLLPLTLCSHFCILSHCL